MEFCQLMAALTQMSLLGARLPCKKELAVALKSQRVEPQSKREKNHQAHPQTPDTIKVIKNKESQRNHHGQEEPEKM